MMSIRADKSGWSIGQDEIIMVINDNKVKRNLLIEYGLFAPANIETNFVNYKSKAVRQLKSYVQLVDCMINLIAAKTSHIVLAKHHLWKVHNIA